MNDEMTPTTEYLNSLSERYPCMEVPRYKFREWYSEEERVIFDCEDEDLERCLDEAMTRDDHAYFKVYIIVQEDEVHSVMDVSYPNIGDLSLRSWLERYHSHLKPASMMSLEGAGKEYIEYLGSSYEE
ncbi:MAG: hypothetical protein ACLFVP_01220 [Candidatus Bathyarchaeia archaeon]